MEIITDNLGEIIIGILGLATSYLYYKGHITKQEAIKVLKVAKKLDKAFDDGKVSEAEFDEIYTEAKPIINDGIKKIAGNKLLKMDKKNNGV